MGESFQRLARSQGISVITCTNRSRCIRNLFSNYNRQRHTNKQLIIIVNDNDIPLKPYKEEARKHNDAANACRLFSITTAGKNIDSRSSSLY